MIVLFSKTCASPDRLAWDMHWCGEGQQLLKRLMKIFTRKINHEHASYDFAYYLWHCILKIRIIDQYLNYKLLLPHPICIVLLCIDFYVLVTDAKSKGTDKTLLLRSQTSLTDELLRSYIILVGGSLKYYIFWSDHRLNTTNLKVSKMNFYVIQFWTLFF